MAKLGDFLHFCFVFFCQKKANNKRTPTFRSRTACSHCLHAVSAASSFVFVVITTDIRANTTSACGVSPGTEEKAELLRRRENEKASDDFSFALSSRFPSFLRNHRNGRHRNVKSKRACVVREIAQIYFSERRASGLPFSPPPRNSKLTRASRINHGVHSSTSQHSRSSSSSQPRVRSLTDAGPGAHNAFNTNTHPPVIDSDSPTSA